MSGLMVAGVVLCLFALLAVVLLVIAPPPRRVAIERRTAPGVEHVSRLTRVTDRTVATIGNVMEKRRSRMFGAEALELAGVRTEPSAFVLVILSVAAVFALIGVLLGFGSMWAVVLAVCFAALSPLLVKGLLVWRTARRRAAFADQLDDTLQLVSGNLRAGHGLMQALDSVARYADAPTSEEFSRIVNESRIGRDLGVALADTAVRMRSDDFHWTAQAIDVNRETGGNLSEVLERTAATIRERNQIRRQVKALSGEGRMSAMILLALPVVVFGFVLILRPGYLAPFFASVFGWIALITAIVLMIIGTTWMYFAVRVKF